MRTGWIVVAVVLIYAVYKALNSYFVCPECGTRFKAGVFNYIFTFHAFNKRMVRCPNCGRSELMTPHWGKDNGDQK